MLNRSPGTNLCVLACWTFLTLIINNIPKLMVKYRLHLMSMGNHGSLNNQSMIKVHLSVTQSSTFFYFPLSSHKKSYISWRKIYILWSRILQTSAWLLWLGFVSYIRTWYINRIRPINKIYKDCYWAGRFHESRSQSGTESMKNSLTSMFAFLKRCLIEERGNNTKHLLQFPFTSHWDDTSTLI